MDLNSLALADEACPMNLAPQMLGTSVIIYHFDKNISNLIQSKDAIKKIIDFFFLWL
jgi:hypothetical protein